MTGSHGERTQAHPDPEVLLDRWLDDAELLAEATRDMESVGDHPPHD